MVCHIQLYFLLNKKKDTDNNVQMKYKTELEKAVDQQEQASALSIEFQMIYLYFITEKPNI